jgi:dephospho-CoA kinase
MSAPLIVVTGSIASGKTSVARIFGARGGVVVDCDRLAHRAYRDKAVRAALVDTFGECILTPSGRISRRRLGKLVFADDRALARLNRIVHPSVKRIISAEVRERRAGSRYIVLDAVLFFQYTFRFKADLVVRTEASVETRVRRLMRRDGMSRKEALRRIERQEQLSEGWSRADITIVTDGPRKKVERATAEIRDRFLAGYVPARGGSRWKKA